MNQEHLEEFFDLLRGPYLEWVRETERGNRRAPHFDISKQLTATLFSYPGFEYTANHRNQDSVDKVVIRMLNDSIDGPTVLFDWGAFDGKRLHKLLTSIPKEKQEQIVTIYGIDMNKQALDQANYLFRDFIRPFKPIPRRIESLDFRMMAEFSNFHDDPFQEMYLPVKPKKLTLALDNVPMNFSGLSYTHDDGITGFFKQTHDEGDIVIMQAHNVTDENIYAKHVEDFFPNFVNGIGLDKILGGKLFASYMSFGKTVHMEQMNEHVEFNGEHYYFPAGIGDADPAKITIGFSGCIPYERMFEFLVFNFANNLFLPSRDDVKYVDSDVVVRLKHFEHNKWIKYAKEESEKFEFNNSFESGLVPYIALKDMTPPFYVNYLYKTSEFAGMSEASLNEFKRRNAMYHSRQVLPPSSFEKLQFDEKDSWS
ncbi:hypothetical protein JXA48_04555 [Candidatus Woesearchaeota archaeon]|nr:hypothetical protein [Candidatus Woesearchaeota archaeon]